jgi:hypothetical protein
MVDWTGLVGGRPCAAGSGCSACVA